MGSVTAAFRLSSKNRRPIMEPFCLEQEAPSFQYLHRSENVKLSRRAKLPFLSSLKEKGPLRNIIKIGLSSSSGQNRHGRHGIWR